MDVGATGLGSRTLTIDPLKYGTQPDATNARAGGHKRPLEEPVDNVSQRFFQSPPSSSGKGKKRRRLRAKVATANLPLPENALGIDSSSSLPLTHFDQSSQAYIAGTRKGSHERNKRQALVAYLRQQLKEKPSELVIRSNVTYFDLSLLNAFSQLNHLTCHMSKLENFYYGDEANCQIKKISFVATDKLVFIGIVELAGLTEVDLTACKALGSLEIRRCRQLTEIVIESLPQLRSVALRDNGNLVKMLCKDCEILGEIHAWGCSNISKVIIDECRRLKELDLPGAVNLKQLDLTCGTQLESLNINDAEALVSLDLTNSVKLKTVSCSRLGSLISLYLPPKSKICFNHDEGMSEKISKLVALNHNVFDYLGVPINTLDKSEELFSFDIAVHEWIHRLGSLHEFSSANVKETAREKLQSHLHEIVELGCRNSSYAAMMLDVMEDALLSCEDRMALSIFDLCRYVPIYNLITSINTFVGAEDVAFFSIDGLLQEKFEEHDHLGSLSVESLYSNLFLFFKVKEMALKMALEVAAQDSDLYASESELARGSIAHKEELAVYLHLVSEVNTQLDDPFYIPHTLYSGSSNSGVEAETAEDMAFSLMYKLNPSDNAQKKELMDELCDFLVSHNGRSDVVRDLLIALHKLGLFNGIPDFRTFFSHFEESVEGDAQSAYERAYREYHEQCKLFEPSNNETPYDLKFKRRKAHF